MSQWTHVNGRFTFDEFYSLKETRVTLGNSYDLETPKGSEGELNVDLNYSYKTTSQAFTTITIHGDLRDFNDEQSIIDWVNKHLKDKIIRSGVIIIDVEGSSSNTYKVIDDKLKLIHSEKKIIKNIKGK